MIVPPFATVDALVAALAAGAHASDEPELDVLAHSLQCGHLLHTEHPDDAELAVAGLVHDVWDAVSPGDHRDHDIRGAVLVAPLLGARVARLVAGHVQAKRYLVASDATYRNGLSGRSTATLLEQGGGLDDDAIAALEASSDFDATITLRRADERAKVSGASVPALEQWRALLLEVSSQSG
ncbi:MAG: metal-dependent phosphohydrolase [Actinomycetia bacterium]|nr:metal-dependent phosphohydrolase [Actinomycetes bacterium]